MSPGPCRGLGVPQNIWCPHHTLFLEQRPLPPGCYFTSFEVQTAGGSPQLAAAPPDPELGLPSSYRGWSGAGSAPQSSEGLTPALCPGEKRIWPSTKRGSPRFHLPLWEVQSGLTKMLI